MLRAAAHGEAYRLHTRRLTAWTVSNARGVPKRAKTDAIDAQTLAQLAMVLQPEPWMPPPKIYYELQQRLAQRDDLLNLRQQVRNQLHALDQHPEVSASVRTRMERLLVLFQSQIDEVEGEIAAALNPRFGVGRSS